MLLDAMCESSCMATNVSVFGSMRFPPFFSVSRQNANFSPLFSLYAVYWLVGRVSYICLRIVTLNESPDIVSVRILLAAMFN